jgi:DNA polymerase/3'-5' exonuclease PolX
MKLSDALPLAQQVCASLAPFCERVEVAGSVRRGKAEVHDVDIVAIPKAVDQPSAFGGIAHYKDFETWKLLFPVALRRCGLKLGEAGPELMRCSFADGFQVDVYHARPETWGVILLVRTGSREHNVKLCTLAKSKGLKLSAAQGVLMGSEVIACGAEEEIFAALELDFVEPKNREVLW